jgi:hypothetical protein
MSDWIFMDASVVSLQSAESAHEFFRFSKEASVTLVF